MQPVPRFDFVWYASQICNKKGNNIIHIICSSSESKISHICILFDTNKYLVKTGYLQSTYVTLTVFISKITVTHSLSKTTKQSLSDLNL